VDGQRRSAAVGVGVVALALIGFSVADSRADQRGVCVDRSSDVRVADDECDDGGHAGGHGWYYIPSGRRAPAEGQPVAGQGSFTAPSDGSFTKGGVAADGGTVTRGGFFSGKSSFGG
jgi:hypothetical protein